MPSHGVTIGRQSLLRDLLILPGLLTAIAGFTGFAPDLPAASAAGLAWSLWIVLSILMAAFRAMAHADHLAELLGEPIGTIILTISAITIEVAAICAIMLHATSDEEAVVVRDTMFAVLMIILNGLVGGSLLIGGLLKREQSFNLQSSAAYIPLIVALAAITLVLPRFTRSAEGGWMSDPMEIFVGAASLVVYLAFLWLQTSRHREFFAHQEDAAPVHRSAGVAGVEASHHAPPNARRAVIASSATLFVALLVVVGLAEGLGPRVYGMLDAFYLPAPIGGVLIAMLVLAPEGLASLKAAGSNDMQRTINVLLGSALATIGLTVPAIMVFRWITGISPEMGLDPPSIVLLAITLLLSAINLTRGRVNALQGMVHLLLFFAWIAVIFDEASAG
ncbi:MAG: calcium:proton antiporter [Phycisphaerales bacterium]